MRSFEGNDMTASLVRWELACVSAEICAVAASLWLLLGSSYGELGAAVLFAVCAVSFAVRVQHYSTLARPR